MILLEQTMPSMPALSADPHQIRLDQVNAELMRLNRQWHDGQISEPKWRQLRAELLSYLEHDLLAATPAAVQPENGTMQTIEPVSDHLSGSPSASNPLQPAGRLDSANPSETTATLSADEMAADTADGLSSTDGAFKRAVRRWWPR